MNTEGYAAIVDKERLITVLRSMRNPEMNIRTFNEKGERGGVPTLTVTANNKNGYRRYTFKHSGLIGLAKAKAEFVALSREFAEKANPGILKKSENVFQLAPKVKTREEVITEAISTETGIANLAHYQNPIIMREYAILTEQQERQIRERGDGNIYGGDRYVGQTIFGVEDDLDTPVEEYIEKVKASEFYKFFVETVSNKVDNKYIQTDPIFHAFSDNYKTLEDVEKELESRVIPSLLKDVENPEENAGISIK